MRVHDSAGSIDEVDPSDQVDQHRDSVASIADLVDRGGHDREANLERGGHDRDDANPRRGRFKVLDEIGVGGTGRVARVRDQRLLRDVAWKRGGTRLLREARILAQLEHPGIVPIHDMGFGVDGEPYFAMRVVRGRSLAEVLRETPMALRPRLLRPLLAAAEAVAYAHRRGVVHRDLKPANIMLGEFGESQVVDWGLARVLSDAASPIDPAARAAVVGLDVGRVGTPGFMSPEQERGAEADRRSDVFALGRVLEAIVGSEAPPELRAIIARCTAPDPAARYPDARAFADDLARHLDGERVAAYRYRAGELVRRFVRRHPTLLVAIALALVALGVFGVVHVTRLDRERGRAVLAEQEARAALAQSDRHLERAFIGEARRLYGIGASAEAAVLAAHALSLGEDADARGVLASVGATTPLTWLGRVRAPCAEAQVDLATSSVLCPEPTRLSLWALDPTFRVDPSLRWSVPMAVRAARVVEDTVVAASPRELHLFDLEGRRLATLPALNDPTRRTIVEGAHLVIEGGGRSQAIDVRARTVTALEPCGEGRHSSMVVARASGAFAVDALCMDGTLRFAAGRAAPELAPIEGRAAPELAPIEGQAAPELAPIEGRAPPGLTPIEGQAAPELGPIEGQAPPELGPIEGRAPPGLTPIEGRAPPELGPIEGQEAVQTPLVAPTREGVRMARAGEWLVVGTNKGEVVVLDRRGGIFRHSEVVAGLVRFVSPSPDLRFVAVAGESESIHVLTLPDLGRVTSLPGRANELTWDPDHPGELVTSGAWLERWRIATPPSASPLVGATMVPLDDGVVALDRGDRDDRDRFAVAFGGGGAMVDAGGVVTRHLGFITTKALAADGDEVIAAGAKGMVRLSSETLERVRDLPDLSVRRLVTLADRSAVVALYGDTRRLRDGDLDVIDRVASKDLSLAPGRRCALLLRDADRTLVRVRASSPEVEVVGVDARAEAVAIAADCEALFTARSDGVMEWDDLGADQLEYVARGAPLIDVEVSGDGRWVAAGARDGAVFLWVRGEAAPRARFVDHTERVPALAFSRDGRWLVSGSWDRTLRARDLAAVLAPIDAVRAELEARLHLGLAEALGTREVR